MRIGLLAGEASGDILGASLIAALKARHPDLRVEGIGGPLMEAQGMVSMFPMDRLSVMGLVEPLKSLPELLRIRGAVFRHFRDNPPDVFVGIDSPDFNLNLERKLRRNGVTTAHLVSPSVWAWRRGRIHKIARSVDLMLTLFPFETAIYKEHDIPVAFVGHPLADALPLVPQPAAAARAALGLEHGKPLLAVLPGSRGGEVKLLAPLFLQAARQLRQSLPDLSLAIPAASADRAEQLRQALVDFDDLDVVVLEGHSRDLMSAADAVLLASGTATLEAMLLKKPMVVGYRMAGLSWAIISRLVKTPFAALPNILADRELVPELLQDAATPEALAAAVRPLLNDSTAATQQVEAFRALHTELQKDFAGACATALEALVEARRV